jgi:hypothetical protein
MRIGSKIAKRGMDLVDSEGVPTDSTTVAVERGKGFTDKVGPVLRVRGT